MESAAVLRSFNHAVSTSSYLRTMIEKPGILSMNKTAFSCLSKLPDCGAKIISCANRRGSVFVSCVKSSDITATAESDSDPNGTVFADRQDGLFEKKSSAAATFSNGFENWYHALLTEVCDETKIAELKVKIGALEIHMKRNTDGPMIPAPVAPQETAPPVPSKPVAQSTPSAPPPAPKASAEKVSPFTNISIEKAAKMATLEASGPSGYVVVSSSTVGSFRRARTLKGKKQPPACKEGDVIKEGQVIGFVDQFSTEFPVKSDVAGEVLKVLCQDTEAVGYGDPLIAVLPSFPGIK